MTEIERKFLVKERKWKAGDNGVQIKQGYLLAEPERVVRVRISGEKAFITIKGKMQNISRPEFEYEIPVTDALQMMKFCRPGIIEKTRFIEEVGGKIWEIDVFEGANSGLILAEIELETEDEKFELPAWASDEVTSDYRYYNSWLSVNPYSEWVGNR
jgi:adenylate cyclase